MARECFTVAQPFYFVVQGSVRVLADDLAWSPRWFEFCDDALPRECGFVIPYEDVFPGGEYGNLLGSTLLATDAVGCVFEVLDGDIMGASDLLGQVVWPG